jgi:hypothetical protein
MPTKKMVLGGKQLQRQWFWFGRGRGGGRGVLGVEVETSGGGGLVALPFRVGDIATCPFPPARRYGVGCGRGGVGGVSARINKPPVVPRDLAWGHALAGARV